MERKPKDELSMQPCGYMESECRHQEDTEHACPFESDVYDNSEPHCKCCVDCTRRCARDV